MGGPTQLLVVGAGPTGLALALQAQAHGARPRLIDRREEFFRPSRALILHSRTLEVLRPLGVAEALLERADTAPQVELRLGRHTVRAGLDALDLPDTPYPHLSLIRQMDVEAVLLQALAARGIAVEWGTELVAAEDGAGAVRATVRSAAGEEPVSVDYLVGCDGPESTVRRAAGIDWRGAPYPVEVVLADLELDDEPASGLAHVAAGRDGLVFLFALGEQASWRLLATRPAGADRLPFGQPGPPVPRAELQALLDAAGMQSPIRELVWSARYRLQHRLADRFRRGRLFLAGDAAHAYSPATGQGLNTGIQDAANLGWKLAFAATAGDRAALLGSYAAERRPAIRRVRAMTRLAFWFEASTGTLPRLLRGELAPLAAPLLPLLLSRRRLLAEGIRTISQLRLAYANSPLSEEGDPKLGGGPRPGERLPDGTVSVDGRRVRLHALLAEPGVHLLLQCDAARLEGVDFGPFVRLHRMSNRPGHGLLAVRPDGYVGFTSGLAEPRQLQAWLARVGAACPAL